MLIRFLSSIRKQPKEVRDRYAFWIATVFTALIAVPWIFGLPGQLASDSTSVESEPIFSSFFNDVGGRFGEVTESIEEVRNPELNTLFSSSSATTTDVDMSFITNDSTSEVVSETPTAVPRMVRIATTSASTTQ